MLKIEKVDTKKKRVYYSGKVTAENNGVLAIYIAQGFIPEEVAPKKKKPSKNTKANWLKVITNDADKAEFEKLAASPKKGGKGFFSAVAWAKAKGYKLK